MTRKALFNIRNGLFDQDSVEAYLKKKQLSDPTFRFFLQKYKSEEGTYQQHTSRYYSGKFVIDNHMSLSIHNTLMKLAFV